MRWKKVTFLWVFQILVTYTVSKWGKIFKEKFDGQSSHQLLEDFFMEGGTK